MTNTSTVVDELIGLLDEATNWLREDNDYLSSIEAINDAKLKVRTALLNVANRGFGDGFELGAMGADSSSIAALDESKAQAWLKSKTRAALQGDK